MKAFLSHSSKDKAFVRQVAATLGEGQCEYDEKSFEYILNVHAIHRALARTDIFVFFLSAHSISSSFVDEEQRVALEKRGAGVIKRILIFTLDDTSYRNLPDWLKEVNVVQRLSSPKVCARKIQSALVGLEAEEDRAGRLRRYSVSPPLGGSPAGWLGNVLLRGCFRGRVTPDRRDNPAAAAKFMRLPLGNGSWVK